MVGDSVNIPARESVVINACQIKATIVSDQGNDMKCIMSSYNEISLPLQPILL